MVILDRSNDLEEGPGIRVIHEFGLMVEVAEGLTREPGHVDTSEVSCASHVCMEYA